MKRITTLFILIISGLFFFAACEIVDPPYLENPGGGDTTQYAKRVLIEDYTGHSCPNCPKAAQTADQLKNIYGDRVVVMAVHAGYFATPVPSDPLFAADFRTPAGNTWNDFFGIDDYPNGMVNRVSNSSGSYTIPYGNWGAVVDEELQKPAEAKITIHSDFDNGQSLFTTTVTTEFLSEQDKAYKLIVCITQDSIIGGQKFPTSIDENYVFMDMLRGTLNGIWGEDVSDGQPIVVGEKYEKTYSHTFPDDWIAKNCHVVAFIYDLDSKYILQVEEKEVIE